LFFQSWTIAFHKNTGHPRLQSTTKYNLPTIQIKKWKFLCFQVSFIARSRKNELEFPCWIGKKDQIVYPCEMVTISFSDDDTKKIVPIIDKAKTRLINFQSENVGESILFVIIEYPGHKFVGDTLATRYLQIKSCILNLIHDDNITLEIGCLDVYNKLWDY
ncbi:MAG: hypothetical protein D3922_05695, partial [Candidatus Electrothrix sp. AR1]|nr:hypothetical protein [Candidatus Electrothrix sp. AR1]